MESHARRLFFVLVGALSLVLALVGFSPAHAADAHITGIVTTNGGAPDTLIDVEALAWDVASSSWVGVDTVQAGPDGAYDLAGLVPGQSYRLRFGSCCVHFEEFYPDATSVEAATSVTAPAAGVNATLEPGGQIVGQVTNKDGTPLAGMAVTWDAPPFNLQMGPVRETGSDGRFRIGMLRSDTYRVCFYDLREPARVPWECYLHATKTDDTPTLVSVKQGLVTNVGQVRLGVPISKPKVEGQLKVGQVVTVDTDSSIPASTARDYRWYANGKPIKKAKGKRLRLTKALRGKRISVRVYAKGTGNLLLQLKVTTRGRVRG